MTYRDELDPARTLSNGLASLLKEIMYADPEDEFTAEELAEILGLEAPVSTAAEYQNTGLMTTDAGVLVRLEDDSEFQVTVVQSKRRRV